MYWLLGAFVVLLLVASVVLGGLGGLTAVFMVMALAGAVAVFVDVIRRNRRIPPAR